MAEAPLDSSECLLCFQELKHPVTLSCQHCFCFGCLQEVWGESRTGVCPKCRRADGREGQTESSDKQALCVFDKGKVSTEEVACGEEEIQRLLEKKEHTANLLKKYEDILKHTDRQVYSCEERIRNLFESFNLILVHEEALCLSALRKQHSEKTQRIEQELQKHEAKLTALLDRIQFADQLSSDSLRDIEDSLTDEPDSALESELLIDEAKIVGNLGFRVWQKIGTIVTHSPVILDPNTSHRNLHLSEDLTSVRRNDMELQVPLNPERFMSYSSVLGSEGFSSGIHKWDVEVGDHPDWSIGLVTESVNRTDHSSRLQQDGFWCLNHLNDSYSNSFNKSIKLKGRPDRITVELHYRARQVSFYDSKDMSLICYSVDNTFTEKLFPYVSVGPAGGASVTKDIKISQISPLERETFSLEGTNNLMKQRKSSEERGEVGVKSKRRKHSVSSSSEPEVSSLRQKRLDSEVQRLVEQKKHSLNIKQQYEDMLRHTERQAQSLKTQRIKLELKDIEAKVASLSERIQSVEQQVQSESSDPLREPDLTPPGSELMIDEAKVLGNVGYEMWRKMKTRAKHSPVVLDPNTANDTLHLSEDLTSVRQTDVPDVKLPLNPERFTCYSSVLGSEGFSSGTHQWDVEVGDHPEWTIGLVKESVNRKDKQAVLPKNGFWCLKHYNNKYINIIGETVRLNRRSDRITVELDYEAGRVSFYDSEDKTLICSHTDFVTEKLFPYFSGQRRLDSEVQRLVEKKEHSLNIKQQYEDMLRHTERQAQSCEDRITQQFNLLLENLIQEKELHLQKLREEKTLKTRRIKLELKNIEAKVASLSERIQSVEQQLQSESSDPLREPDLTPPGSELMIDEAKVLGNLRCKIWSKMKTTAKYSPVILDPNTANETLHLSEDLTSVRQTDVPDLKIPLNPERFTCYSSVLGSEGFSSGTHQWDVEVGDHPEWTIGLVKESVNRGDKQETGPAQNYIGPLGKLQVLPMASPALHISIWHFCTWEEITEGGKRGVTGRGRAL
ncbi:hypothetical protein WMY93_033139 [Mugilogobius chulae]|uniref:Zinc-binding protein A33-like n=1 Tax=Mugilogobius chulae TaxID=88201 RepID=A0AAW0MPQ9_9GOBI